MDEENGATSEKFLITMLIAGLVGVFIFYGAFSLTTQRILYVVQAASSKQAISAAPPVAVNAQTLQIAGSVDLFTAQKALDNANTTNELYAINTDLSHLLDQNASF